MECTDALKRAGTPFSIRSGKKIIIPEKAFVNRQHIKVNPIAFILKRPFKKLDQKVEVGQDLNDWDSGKQTDLFENEKS